MANQVQPYVRRLQLLRAFHENGPLSNRTLLKIIQPPMSERRLRRATKRLHDRGLIAKCHGGLPKNAGNYYQLCRSGKAREEIQRLLKLSEVLPSHAPFRGQDLYHSETCAIWLNRFKALLPEANVIREEQFVHQRDISYLLQAKFDELDLKPDLLIRAPNYYNAGQANIAIEVERFTKSRKRLTQKLRKLAGRTFLDGLIYICCEDTNADVIREVYLNEVKHRAHRIKPYGDHFLLFIKNDNVDFKSPVSMVNSALKPVSIISWLGLLRSIPIDKRKDSDFEDGPGGCPIF